MIEINNANITTVPAYDIVPGQRVVKITRGGKTVFYPVGISRSVQYYTPVVDHIYYHEIYDSVSYLDENNGITSVGWNGIAPTVIILWTASLDGASSGSIVLQYGENQAVVPVSGTVQKFTWNIDHPLQGEISITRLTDDDLDTLKDSNGNCITAIVADWQVM